MLLFLDESGPGARETPYEVYGGVAVPERSLWPFCVRVDELERTCFGGALSELHPGHELKASTLLSRKVYRHARRQAPLTRAIRAELARAAIRAGVTGGAPTGHQLTALAQAKIAYVEGLLEACRDAGAKVFACVVPRGAPRSAETEALRRDIAFLLERYYYYLRDLEDCGSPAMGLLVADEVERAQCRRMLGRLARYFTRTRNGRERSERIIPQPFYVRSDLTTGIHAADVIAYILNWAYRFGPMDAPTRTELEPLARRIRQWLMYTTRRSDGEVVRDVYSVTYVADLRCRDER